MKKILLSFIICISFLSGICLAEDSLLYDEGFLKTKIEKVIPKEWAAVNVEIQYLDSINYDPGKVYIIAHVQKSSSIYINEYSSLNKIYIFEWIKQELKFIWKSDEFIGAYIRLNFDDIDNNKNRNINVSLSKKDTEVYETLLIYDWNKEGTKKVYPLENNEILKAKRTYQFYDFDYDGDIEIKLIRVLQWDPYQHKEEYYILKNGELTFEREYISPIKDKNSKSKNTISSEYPQINEIVEQYCSGELYNVEKLYFEFDLYLVEINPNTQDESRYLIVEKKDNKYKFWYKLDSRFNECGYATDPEFSFDLNKDSYLEMALYDFDNDGYFIFSLRPNKPILISPVDDYFRPLIRIVDKWYGFVELIEEDGDKIWEIISEDDYNGNTISVYWKWNLSEEIYEVYQKKILDVETGEYIILIEDKI